MTLWDKVKTISPATWARTICLLLALVNQVLAILGKEILPFGEEEVYQLVSISATIITGLVAWWKNNSFTQSAIAADNYKDELKSAK